MTRDDDAIPTTVGKPAMRALAAPGYTCLSQLTQVSEAEIGRLHGVGPKAVNLLRSALAERGRSFVDG